MCSTAWLSYLSCVSGQSIILLVITTHSPSNVMGRSGYTDECLGVGRGRGEEEPL